MEKEILVFKKEAKDLKAFSDILSGYDLKIWKPKLFNLYPPNKNLKYIFYWLFHFFRIFKNRNYSAYLLYDNNTLISSFLVVPAHFKWPFMKSEDVQFTYVMTSSHYRGMGIAGKLILKALSDLNKNVKSFWYVTDSENIASIKVAEKIGFEFQNKASKTGYLKVLKVNDQ